VDLVTADDVGAVGRTGRVAAPGDGSNRGVRSRGKGGGDGRREDG